MRFGLWISISTIAVASACGAEIDDPAAGNVDSTGGSSKGLCEQTEAMPEGEPEVLMGRYVDGEFKTFDESQELPLFFGIQNFLVTMPVLRTVGMSPRVDIACQLIQHGEEIAPPFVTSTCILSEEDGYREEDNLFFAPYGSPSADSLEGPGRVECTVTDLAGRTADYGADVQFVASRDR